MSYQAPVEIAPSRQGPVDSHRVYMLGAPGVGKAALISQFQTSECINAYEGPGKLFGKLYFLTIIKARYKLSLKILLTFTLKI